jgi:hypothetical protein
MRAGNGTQKYRRVSPHILIMKKKHEVVYVVKRGGKYEPVGVIDIGCHYPIGSYLVRVRKNSSGIRVLKKDISVSAARVELAMSEMADAIVWALGEADKVEHKPKRNSPLEQKAFEEYKRICGEEHLQMSRKSRNDVAYAAMAMVRQIMGKKQPCPDGCFDALAEKEAK